MSAAPPRTVTMTITGPLERAELPALSARTCALMDGAGAKLLRCEVDGLAANAVAVDALARLALAARRRGCKVLLSGASEDLGVLVRLVGIEQVFSAGG